MAKFCLAFLVPFLLQATDKGDPLLNPFKKDYGSLLDFNRFKTSQQISFFSTSSKNFSRSLGVYLNTLEYSINPDLQVNVHLGKKLDFNQKQGPLSMGNKEDFLKGGSLVYRIRPDFSFGIEYGDTPESLGLLPYLPSGMVMDKNVKLWLNKSFGASEFNVYFLYRDFKASDPLQP